MEKFIILFTNHIDYIVEKYDLIGYYKHKKTLIHFGNPLKMFYRMPRCFLVFIKVEFIYTPLAEIVNT